MKKILITGGAGFIGSHLVDRLLAEKQWEVTVLDDFNGFYAPVVKYHNIARHINNPAFSLFGGTVLSEQVLKGIFSENRFDCVVHLAAQTGESQSMDDPIVYERINVRGTLNLLETARTYNVRQFVFSSSAAVYGSGAKVPFNEEMPVNRPVSTYGATKTTGELLCHAYSHVYKMCCVCLRLFNVYGPRQRPDLDLYRYARSIEASTPLAVYGESANRHDYIHISDVLDSLRSAISYDLSGFEVFNIGAGSAVKTFEIIKLLEREMDRKAIIENLPQRTGEMTETLADTGKAKKFLRFSPKVSIESGIRHFAQWFMRKRPLNENESSGGRSKKMNASGGGEANARSS